MISKYITKYRWLLIALSVFCVGGVWFFYTILTSHKTLPIYSPHMVHADLVDTSIQEIRKYHRIKDFSFINQDSMVITQDTYKNKIYITDFFFTTCQTICPKMTQNLKYIQNNLPKESGIQLLSHTVIPEYDTPKILKEYAITHGVDTTKWNLVTGNKKDLYDMARKSYLVSKTQGNGGKYDMIHTENIVLIDKKRQIRGYYNGTNPKEIAQLLEDALWLEKSYIKKN